MVETRWIYNYGQIGVQAIADVNSGGSMPAEIPDLFGSAVLSWDRAVSGAAISADGRLHRPSAPVVCGRARNYAESPARLATPGER